MKGIETGRKARIVYWLAGSLFIHAALLIPRWSDAPQRLENNPGKHQVEVGLIAVAPRKSAPPSVSKTTPTPETVPSAPRTLARLTTPFPEESEPFEKESAAPFSRSRPEGSDSAVSPPPRPAPVVKRQEPPRDRPVQRIVSPQPPQGGQRKPSTPKTVAAENPSPPRLPELGIGSRDDSGLSRLTAPQVEASPRYDLNTPPAYPRTALLRGWEGVVLLRVTVGADGLPQQVNVERSSEHSVLDHAAVRAVRRWRFRPARRDGRAVPDEVIVPLHFELRR